MVNSIAQELHAGNRLTHSPQLLGLVGNLILQQLGDGFGKNYLTVDYDTPDAEMLQRITRDVWHFSAAKCYNELRDMTLALRNPEGSLRTFQEFKAACGAIGDRYNSVWLKTEYDQAAGASTMAARWVEFKKNEKLMPYLRYSTVGDARVRDTHRALDGTVRKLSDAFWATYFPPNGWRCRCSADQLPFSHALETQTIPEVPVSPMFRTNLAQSGLLFPSGHPYYDNVPKEVLQDAISYLPANAAYSLAYKAEAGASVYLHPLHGIQETKGNMAAAKLIADAGHTVHLLPVLQTDAQRERVYGTKSFVKGKNPDAKIDDAIAEIKVLEGASKTSIHNAIRKGQKQADLVIIRLTKDMDSVDILDAVKGQLEQSTYASDIWVIANDGQLVKYSRERLGLPKKAERPTK